MREWILAPGVDVVLGAAFGFVGGLLLLSAPVWGSIGGAAVGLLLGVLLDVQRHYLMTRNSHDFLE